MSVSQNRFRKARSTIDSIYIINHSVKWKLSESNIYSQSSQILKIEPDCSKSVVADYQNMFTSVLPTKDNILDEDVRS